MTAFLKRWSGTFSNPKAVTARNIVVNVIGRAWSMVISVLFVPLYLRLLGIESYGIIGFYTTLAATFALLDLGLSATLNREVARRSVRASDMAMLSVVLRTLENVYWAIGALIGLTVVALAPLIARDWLHSQHLGPAMLITVIRLMGLTIALQWPIGLYGGGLIGLQRHVQNNVFTVAIATLRALGVLPILLLAPSLENYFLWQVLVSMVAVLAIRSMLWRALPADRAPPRFDLRVLYGLWQFAAGMTGMSLVSIVLAQADKVVLSAVLPLDDYGRYVLAGAMSSACGFMAAPISTVLYPKVTQAVAAGDRAAVRRLYHGGCELMALAVIPLITTIVFFSREVLLFWTHDAAVADSTWQIASVLTVGLGFTALMLIPYELQLANGSTRFTLTANIVAAVCVVPGVYLLGTRVGALGAAFVSPLWNLIYLIVLPPMIHRRFLPGATRAWLIDAVGKPLLTSAAIVAVGRWLLPVGSNPLLGFTVALATGGMALAATAAVMPQSRSLIRQLHAKPPFRRFGLKP